MVAESEEKRQRAVLRSAGVLERKKVSQNDDILAAQHAVATKRVASAAQPRLRNRVNDEVGMIAI